MAQPVKIEIADVEKRFTWSKNGVKHDVHVLDDVSLDIRDGEFLTVIGPSGCGKTTLLRIIGGLTGIQGGSVKIDGRPVTGPGPDRSIVFQSFGLFPWKTVIENVAFPLEIRRLGKAELRQRCLSHLEMVGLSKFTDAYPHQLSGGMQQRVAIARALAFDPSLLLMDEPFGALDEITRSAMRYELLRVWSSAGNRKTVLFVTHSIAEALAMSDRVIVLSSRPGRVVADLDIELARPRTQEIERSPAFLDYSDYLRGLLREAA